MMGMSVVDDNGKVTANCTVATRVSLARAIAPCSERQTSAAASRAAGEPGAEGRSRRVQDRQLGHEQGQSRSLTVEGCNLACKPEDQATLRTT